jgi:hypothetical protein
MIYKHALTALIITCLVLPACTGKKEDKVKTDSPGDSGWVTVTPKKFIDFEYSKAIAFATVDPHDYEELYYQKNMDPSRFIDTISITLGKGQTTLLDDILSGRYRKPYHKDSLEEVPVADCFFPRHNLIFTGPKGSVAHFISVCFECGNRKESKPDLADMDNLRMFFDSIGLKVFFDPMAHKEYYRVLKGQRIIK